MKGGDFTRMSYAVNCVALQKGGRGDDHFQLVSNFFEYAEGNAGDTSNEQPKSVEPSELSRKCVTKSSDQEACQEVLELISGNPRVNVYYGLETTPCNRTIQCGANP